MPPDENGGGAAPAVALLLRGPDGPQPLGRPAAVRVEVRNEGATELWIAGVLDGSEAGVRCPRYRPTVSRDGVVVAEPAAPEDPLVGPLRAADLRRLGPGEGFDPTLRDGGAAVLPLATFMTFAPSEPGAYRYELTLSTECAPEEWLGRFGQDKERAAVLELVARVPRLSLASNALEVTFR